MVTICKKCGEERIPRQRCKGCRKIARRNWRKNNPEKVLSQRQRYRKKHKQQTKNDRLKWINGNGKESAKAIHKRWRSTLNGAVCQAILRAKAYCKKRQVDIDIDIVFLHQLLDDQNGLCAITNMRMTYKSHDLKSMSVDRIDPLKGYTKNNTHLVCKWVNFAKSNHSLEEIKSILLEFKTND